MLIEVQCLLDCHRQLERFTSAYRTACREIIARRASAFQTRRDHVRASCAKRSPPISLLWWVFLANGTVLVVASLLLAVTPITISAPINVGQLALLVGGLAVMLVLNLLVLRGVLSPFFRLTEVMSSVDPERPGRRLTGLISA